MKTEDFDANDKLFLIAVRGWIEKHTGVECDGALIVSFHANGWDIQYVGNEDLDADGLIKRLAWVAGHSLLTDYDVVKKLR